MAVSRGTGAMVAESRGRTESFPRRDGRFTGRPRPVSQLPAVAAIAALRSRRNCRILGLRRRMQSSNNSPNTASNEIRRSLLERSALASLYFDMNSGVAKNWMKNRGSDSTGEGGVNKDPIEAVDASATSSTAASLPPRE